MTHAPSLPRAATFPAPLLCRTPSDCAAKTSTRPCRSCAATERAARISENHAFVTASCDYYRKSATEAWKYLAAERAALAKANKRLTLWKLGAIIDLLLCIAIVAAFIVVVRR